VTWVIKRQIKLLNSKAYSCDFTRLSADKMAAGVPSKIFGGIPALGVKR
jgi:hypothetical protein